LVNSGPRPPEADTFPEATGPAILYYRNFTTADSDAPLGEWTPFSGAVSLILAPGKYQRIALATRRNEMPGSGIDGSSSYQSILRVTDSGGTRQDVPVTVGSRSAPPAAAGGAQPIQFGPLSTTSRSGLWVGYANLTGVSWAVANRKLIAAAADDDRFETEEIPRPAGLDPDAILPTSSEFQFRVIIHVDAAGQAKLLQRVIQVWEDGTNREDPLNPGLYLPETPGRFKLFSNEQGADAYRGATLRSGIQIPKRLSTAAYPLQQPLSLNGEFGAEALTGNVVLGYDDPLNPFVHRFHPQHDNLDARYNSALPPGVESFAVSRAIKFEFSEEHPEERVSPGWGESELGGTYRENITGLHRSVLHVGGTFVLRRVSSIPEID
jgi:hypothetical protein